MKKGFTLIELLAVIVILAIIALIATPIIINIINESRESANERSAELYLESAKQALAAEVLKNRTAPLTTTCSVITTADKLGNLYCTGIGEIPVNMNNKNVTNGTIVFEEGKIVSVTGLIVNGTEYNQGSNEQTGFTGTIYRHSKVPVAITNSEAASIVGFADTIHPWCAVVSSIGVSSCIDNAYGVHATFKSKSECQIAIDSIGSDPDATAEQKQLAQVATCEQGTIPYQTSSNSIDSAIYLKHEISNDIITASYACIKYTEDGITKEACVRGGDPSYHGTFDGISLYVGYDDTYISDVSTLNPTGNIAVVSSTHDYFYGNSGYCEFNDWHSDCRGSLFGLEEHDDGYVNAHDFDAGEQCYVAQEGYSYCK